MSDQEGEKKPKLETYMVYGMIFGLLTGSVLSSIGMTGEIGFIQIAGPGFGLLGGMLTGMLVYLLKGKKG
ncbi:hypothetical protein [Alteribacter keqinensis]|uniref:Uncharacterized protein n=1 Tax=Alteribacter keqinensis TaxID=2483800 RepID=A0A3M7TPG8_9BACI|nr:hypothetical protein [Alteribacter keqinensis]RNA66917.1 hypothetical protein EBO34_17090 [Alteribacter keqinensis]